MTISTLLWNISIKKKQKTTHYRSKFFLMLIVFLKNKKLLCFQVKWPTIFNLNLNRWVKWLNGYCLLFIIISLTFIFCSPSLILLTIQSICRSICSQFRSMYRSILFPISNYVSIYPFPNFDLSYHISSRSHKHTLTFLVFNPIHQLMYTVSSCWSLWEWVWYGRISFIPGDKGASCNIYR